MPPPFSSSVPALLIAGDRSGCGKTTITLALMAAFVRRGMVVQGFKTGPDFIDPAWHTVLTGRPSFNLDPWMCGGGVSPTGKNSPEKHTGREDHENSCAAAHPQGSPLFRQFSRTAAADVAVIEGAMGLYDGLPNHPASAADVALQLGVPVLLVLDCRGVAATAVAVAQGLAGFRPGLPLLGAVCTFVGGTRHAELLRRAFEVVPDIPLLGLFPRDDALQLPSRHLGLISAREGLTPALLDALVRQAELHLDLDGILSRAKRFQAAPPASLVTEVVTDKATANPAKFTRSAQLIEPVDQAEPPVKIALARDEAFSFWYPEHDILLAKAGAEILPFSPLRDSGLPDGAQGLILPGGYPELHAAALSANHSMRDAIRAFALRHPVYGECGGYLYLMDFLEIDGKLLPFCGCLPLTARLESGRAALGYREVVGLGGAHAGPWAGLTLRGHEFHYTRIVERPDNLPHLWASHAPALPDVLPAPEGAALGNVCGSYIHLSWLSHPLAAARFVNSCRRSPGASS